MANVHEDLGVKRISDLILKEIYGSYGAKTLQKSKLRDTERQKEKFMKV